MNGEVKLKENQIRLWTLKPCVFTKFAIIAHMLLLIAHYSLVITHALVSFSFHLKIFE